MPAALVTAVALLLPVRSYQQLAFTASLGLALLVMYGWGRSAARRFLDADGVGPATAIFAGQWALLAFAEVATTANATLSAAAGWSIPLVPLVLLPSIVLLIGLVRRAWRTREEWLWRLPRPLSVLSLGSLAVVNATYARHLAALGLDTHQHIAWVRQIATAGFVPLVEPGTSILAEYPRTFHLLAALWNAAGLGLPPGPFVKVMPFLQAGLAAVAGAELLARILTRPDQRGQRRRELVLGLAAYVYAFLLVPTALPAPDLSGTPRLASLGLLLLPVLLLSFAAAHRSGTAARWSATILPLVAAWSLTTNPMLVVLLITASVPTAILAWVALAPALPRPGRWSWTEIAVLVALALLVVVRDPWIVSQVAQRSRSVAAFLEWRGVSTYAAAVAAGLASDHDKIVRDRTTAPPCRHATCVVDNAGTVARDLIGSGVEALGRGGRELLALAQGPSTKRTENALAGSLPIQPSNVSPHAALPMTALLVAALGCALGTLARRAGPLGLPSRLFLCWMAGVVVSGFAVQLAGGLASALGDQSHDAILLAAYLSVAGRILFVGWFWFAFLLAALVLDDAFARSRTGPEDRSGDRASWRPSVARGAALALSLALPPLATLNLDGARRNRTFLSPISFTDLAALHRVERTIPPDDAVIVPAEHSNIGDFEHWVLPVGDTAALLPYGDRRYLFNVYLGASYTLSWHDLEERLCGPSREARQRLLDDHRARWFLVRDSSATTPEQALARATLCEKPATSLFPNVTLARADHGVFLFHLARVTPGS